MTKKKTPPAAQHALTKEQQWFRLLNQLDAIRDIVHALPPGVVHLNNLDCLQEHIDNAIEEAINGRPRPAATN